MLIRSGQRVRRADPAVRLPDRDPQRRRQRPRQAGLAQLTRQVPPLRVPDRLVVDQCEPVPEPLEPLQEPHEPGVVVALQAAVLEQLQQMLIPHGEGVERRINGVRTPEIHTDMLLEYTFESK